MLEKKLISISLVLVRECEKKILLKIFKSNYNKNLYKLIIEKPKRVIVPFY